MTFFTASLETFAPREKFDLVVCAETLYYIREVREAISILSSLGRRCIVSYIQRESSRLDGEIEKIPRVEIRRHEIGTKLLRRGMVVATWETESVPSGRERSRLA